ncbi:LysR family transcriptional regulator [Aidingimonas halophila]|uniref:DNA-binding transcriptional regulator, LysR family n=1 Tax=Aidingimonas halophila TaxID=574349 RepID=A0A1H3CSW1_9GAMM|nr:LysR family transcriptional regulator [Aidingimonas halophila]GHC39355.1 LysR family transcriptional regulator [Aidingimonas halophila]SDX57233.1 DNA-binding transcriptional regulator, LysR family [Aidingimonas halophila]
MNLLLPGLRYFEEVARQGSLRKASEQLHVAASAINRQILRLEDELGVPLFERLPRGLRLSPAGELILYQVQQWQRDERRLQEYLGEIRGTGCAEVRVATIESLTDQLLPRVLSEFSGGFPRIRFMMVTGLTDDILEQVVSGDADLGLCMNPPATPKVRFVEKVELEFGAVLAPHHPLAEREALWLRECQSYPAILPGNEMFHGSTLQQVLAAADIELDPLATGNRILGLKSLARAGLGIAFLNRLDIARELAQGELLFKPLKDRHIAKARLVLCTHSDRALPMATAVLVEQLREAMLAIEPGS